MRADLRQQRIDEDMNKIMMAVLEALQHEQERHAEIAAEQGNQPT